MYENKFETDLHQYAELRTILDSLEMGALRHFLNAASLEEQKENFCYLQTAFKPIIEHLWAAAEGAAGGCPPGYVECYGCCVPYPCVG